MGDLPKRFLLFYHERLVETLKMRTKCSHFALKQKLYVVALQAAFGQRQTLQPNNLRMSA